MSGNCAWHSQNHRRARFQMIGRQEGTRDVAVPFKCAGMTQPWRRQADHPTVYLTALLLVASATHSLDGVVAVSEQQAEKSRTAPSEPMGGGESIPFPDTARQLATSAESGPAVPSPVPNDSLVTAGTEQWPDLRRLHTSATTAEAASQRPSQHRRFAVDEGSASTPSRAPVSGSATASLHPPSLSAASTFLSKSLVGSVSASGSRPGSAAAGASGVTAAGASHKPSSTTARASASPTRFSTASSTTQTNSNSWSMTLSATSPAGTWWRCRT